MYEERPMPLANALERLKSDKELGPNFVEWRHIPASPPSLAPFPAALDGQLAEALAHRGIERLYSHQAEAVEAVLAGRNVAIVTPTASGKTLCYNLPVLQTVLSDPNARALYLFPTKALAQDQLNELHGLVTDLGADVKTYTYDGDTPADARRAVRAAGTDELHQYRGLFGSHVANVIRRLRRVCRFYGSDPVFICCSATIANPGELAERLIGAPVQVIDRNRAPRGERR